MIGLDTFVWGKLIRLRNSGWKSLIDDLLEKGNFFITHEVKKEFMHFYKDDLALLEYVQILPVLNKKMYEYTQKGFDDADASLLEYSDVKKYRICTEDKPMLMEGISSYKKIFQVIDLFSEFYRNDFIYSRELYHLVKILKKWKNITDKKEKDVRELMRLNK